ncbi:MAG: hypothetical protein QOF19_1500, partial [Alphaproteobacteria bacterium]|nr:hypothetical protein [Alphaproteobacteria bacterium]
CGSISDTHVPGNPIVVVKNKAGAGEQIQEVIQKTYSAPPQVLDRL